MDAARELAQLGERDRELLADLVDRAGEPGVDQPRLEHPQVERERDELLLGAVVQVALDPAARVVGGLDDPQPRDPQLLDPRAQLGLQALVVDRERGGGRGRGDELRRGVELGVVDDRRDAARRRGRPPSRRGRSRGPAARRGGRRRRRRSRGRAASRRSSASGRRARSASSSRTGPLLGRTARAQQPARERAQRGVRRPRGRDRDDRRRRGRAGSSTIPAGGPSAQRPDELPSSPAEIAPTPRTASSTVAATAPAPRATSAGERDRQVERQQPDHLQPARSDSACGSAHACRRARSGTGSGGRCASSSRLAWRRSPSASATAGGAVRRSRAAARPTATLSTTPSTSRRRSPAGTSGPGRAPTTAAEALAARRAGAARVQRGGHDEAPRPPRRSRRRWWTGPGSGTARRRPRSRRGRCGRRSRSVASIW